MYKDTIQNHSPLIHFSSSSSTRMWLVCFCSLLVILQSSLSDSFYSLIIALTAVLAALLTEFFILYFKNSKTSLVKDGSAVATALVFTLLLPNRIPLPYVVMGTIFAVGIIKHCFGGLGSNWLNPAAGGWFFVRLSWPGVFNMALDNSPLSLLEKSVTSELTEPLGMPLRILETNYPLIFGQNIFMENSIYVFFNNTVFPLFSAALPASYVDLFVSSQPGIIADRGILALLLGTILITSFRTSRSWIPAVWISVFGFLTLLAGAVPYGGELWKGDILFSFLTGGTLAAAFILAAEPVSSAKSKIAVIISAAAGGFFAWLFRFPGAEPYGAIISVLLINALLPLIRHIAKNLLLIKGRTL